MSEENTAGKNLFCFPIGTIGRDMIYCLVSNFLLTYAMFTRQLSEAQLAAITAIMVGSRVLAAVSDPIVGISSNARGRNGESSSRGCWWGRSAPLWLSYFFSPTI